MAREVTDFGIEVIERSRQVPVLVDFWAPWCGPCRMLGPVLERLEARSGGAWELIKVNTDEQQELAQEYQVQGIPSVKLFVDGGVADEFTGAMPEAAVDAWLRKALPGKGDAKVVEAGKLLAGGNPELAEAVLREALKDEPGNRQARLMLARLTVFSDPAGAAGLVEGIGEGDEGYDLADAVRSFARLFEKAGAPGQLPESAARPHCMAALEALRRKDFGQALGEFIEALKADRGFLDDCARKACVAVFHYLGEEHEITRKYRRPFGSALHV